VRGTDTSNIRMVERVIVQGPPGASQTVQPNREVCLIVCSVKQGGVDVFFGSGPTGGRLAPDLHFGQSNRPVCVPIPCGQYEFTVVALGPDSLVLASVIFGGP